MIKLFESVGIEKLSGGDYCKFERRNLLGPDQFPDLARSTFTRQIALSETNGNQKIITGNLATSRDFIDVRESGLSHFWQRRVKTVKSIMSVLDVPF
jgi:2-phosphoglycerate kinase